MKAIMGATPRQGSAFVITTDYIYSTYGDGGGGGGDGSSNSYTSCGCGDCSGDYAHGHETCI